MTASSATRFAKGQSGNPRGRPRKRQVAPDQSAFGFVIDRTLTVTQNGVERELTVDEALQQRTYQDAIAGSRPARREILKMIVKREKWIAAHGKKGSPPLRVRWVSSGDPDNAHDALLLLGIATRDEARHGSDYAQDPLLLEPWAVEAALKRSRKREFEAKDLDGMKRCTRNADMIRWP